LFRNLGKTLTLLRQLRSKSQALLAREAGVAKSQLSKYESGRELPRLDSLEKLLGALDIGVNEFFYTLTMVNERGAALASLEPSGERFRLSLLSAGGSLLRVDAEKAFSRLLILVLDLHKLFCEEGLLGGVSLVGGTEDQGASGS
jgi:transcriptional regulator with XRE-family HTH domain